MLLRAVPRSCEGEDSGTWKMGAPEDVFPIKKMGDIPIFHIAMLVYQKVVCKKQEFS